MKTKMIILTLFLAGSLLGVVLAMTAMAAPAATISVDSVPGILIAGDPAVRDGGAGGQALAKVVFPDGYGPRYWSERHSSKPSPLS